MKQPVIARLESHTQRRVSSDALKRLARTLGVSADYLIGMYEDEESEWNPAAAVLIGV